MLVSQPENRYYLSGFSGSDGYLFINRHEAVLATDFRYLEQARALGDFLVVAVNSDASVRQLKGAGRPVVPADQRAEVLAALAAVDLALIFDDLDPGRVIRSVRPDVLVKGGDWSMDRIVGADFVRSIGGRVRSLPYVKGTSTSALIRRLAFGGRHQPPASR